ncbi:hypothetical protein BC833DRAFT_596461 [Globomyces pollinis-pini]|nr:hypothetical protein BC833DRAFT_596461 [Globomyces pollinis-pini]
MYNPIFYDPIKFSALTKVFLSISVILFHVAWLSNAILIYIFFRNYHTSTTCYEKCICFLLFCELSWSFPFSVIYSYMLTRGESFGFEGCQWTGPLLPLVCGMTIFAHGMLAIERYFTIILQKSMESKHFIILSSIFVPIVGFLSFSPLFIGTGFVLNDKHYCYYNFKQTKNGGDVAILLVMFVTFFSLFGIIMYCYSKIYFTFVTKKSSDVKKNSTRDRLNSKIFYTCVTVVGCFTMSFSPLITTLVVQILFNYEFPDVINHLSTTISVFDCLLTPLCLVLLVPSYKQGFRKHVYDYKRSQNTSQNQLDANGVDQTR